MGHISESDFFKKLSTFHALNHSKQENNTEHDTSGIQYPAMYSICIINDETTPMDFVFTILQRFFGKTDKEAKKIIVEIHKHGEAVCATYTRDVAKTKLIEVRQYILQHVQPLQCVLKQQNGE